MLSTILVYEGLSKNCISSGISSLIPVAKQVHEMTVHISALPTAGTEGAYSDNTLMVRSFRKLHAISHLKDGRYVACCSSRQKPLHESQQERKMSSGGTVYVSVDCFGTTWETPSIQGLDPDNTWFQYLRRNHRIGPRWEPELPWGRRIWNHGWWHKFALMSAPSTILPFKQQKRLVIAVNHSSGLEVERNSPSKAALEYQCYYNWK